MPTTDGSAEVPEGSVNNRESIMQKRETISAESRAPADRHPTAVMSFLVATLSEHVRQLCPVGIGKTTAPREQSHVAYLAQHQSASQYIGALLVEVVIEQQYMHHSTLHGLLESLQSEFVPSFDSTPPPVDFVRTWEMRRVKTFHAGSKSDRGPKQLWPYRWCWKLLNRYPLGDTSLRLQAVTHCRRMPLRRSMHHTACSSSTGNNPWSAFLANHSERGSA